MCCFIVGAPCGCSCCACLLLAKGHPGFAWISGSGFRHPRPRYRVSARGFASSSGSDPSRDSDDSAGPLVVECQSRRRHLPREPRHARGARCAVHGARRGARWSRNTTTSGVRLGAVYGSAEDSSTGPPCPEVMLTAKEAADAEQLRRSRRTRHGLSAQRRLVDRGWWLGLLCTARPRGRQDGRVTQAVRDRRGRRERRGGDRRA